MAIQYTYEGDTFRIQIEYLQFFPTRSEMHCSVNVINTQSFDVKKFDFIVGDPEYTAIISQTASAIAIGPQVMQIAYLWLIANVLDEMVLNRADPPEDYVAPSTSFV